LCCLCRCCCQPSARLTTQSARPMPFDHLCVHSTSQALNPAMIVFSALMIWKGLMFITKSESPVVVVLSGSMEPAFQRGDILFLNNQVAKRSVVAQSRTRDTRDA